MAYDGVLKPFSLEGWHACLAVAARRLAKTDFLMEIGFERMYDRKRVGLEGTVRNLTVSTMETGRELVKLGLDLDCRLESNERCWGFERTRLEIVTPFRVDVEGGVHLVRPDFSAAEFSVNHPDSVHGVWIDGILDDALKEWIRSKAGAEEFILFGFRVGKGASGGKGFEEIVVSTAHASYSPVCSSFLVLFAGEKKPERSRDLTLDPHVLPTGQTAALWMAEDFLKGSSGEELVETARKEWLARPLAIKDLLPELKEIVKGWERTVIDDVSVPGGFEISSMEFGTGCLMFSATPFSEIELDSFCSHDLTSGEDDLVNRVATGFFQDCVVYCMDDGLRRDLLGVQKPKLLAEVAVLAEGRREWFVHLGRLLVAKEICCSALGETEPFVKIDPGLVSQAIQKNCLGNEYSEIAVHLYPLAFCVVHPRLSIYLKEKAVWGPRYCSFLESDVYIDALLSNPNYVAKLHDDCAKLQLLEPDGPEHATNLAKIMANVVHTMADRNWAMVIRERRVAFQEALVALLGHTLGAGDHPGLVQAVQLAGGAKALANSFTEWLGRTNEKSRASKMNEAIANWAEQAGLCSVTVREGMQPLVLAAVVAVLLLEIQADVLPENRGEAQEGGNPGWTAAILANELFHAKRPGIDIGRILREKLVSVIIKSVKAFKFVTKTVAVKLFEASKSVVWSIKTISGLCGSVLCSIGAVIMIMDAAKSLHSGNIGSSVISFIQAGLAVLEVFTVILPVSGTFSLALLVVGAGLVLVQFLFFKDKTDQEKTVDHLMDALGQDRVLT